jgi:hypothetical protein
LKDSFGPSSLLQSFRCLRTASVRRHADQLPRSRQPILWELRLPAARRETLAGVQRQIVRLFAHQIRLIRPELFARDPITLTPITMSLFGMLNWFYQWHQEGKGISRAQYADLATDLLLGGLETLSFEEPDAT